MPNINKFLNKKCFVPGYPGKRIFQIKSISQYSVSSAQNLIHQIKSACKLSLSGHTKSYRDGPPSRIFL